MFLRSACFIGKVFLAKNKTSGLGTTQMLDYRDIQMIERLIKGTLLYHNLVQIFFCHFVTKQFRRGVCPLVCVSVCALWGLQKKLTIKI
jgi:hypothetical protein